MRNLRLSLLVGALLLSGCAQLGADVTASQDPAGFIRAHLALGERECPTLEHKITFWTALLGALEEPQDLSFNAITVPGEETEGITVQDSIILFSAMLQVEDECLAAQVPGHFLFVTSEAFPLSPGFSPSTLCTDAAEAAGFEGQWKALLSNSGYDARSLVTVNGPVYSTRPVTGQTGWYYRLADDAADLWDGTLAHPVCDEHGVCGTVRNVRTGSNANGARYGDSASEFCADWSSTVGSATPSGSTHAVGDMDDLQPGAPNDRWLRSNVSTPMGCHTNSSLYCFQQTPTSQCGNGIPEIGEACDRGEANGTPCITAYSQSCTTCTETCEEMRVAGAFCGDGVVQGPENGGEELCDDGKHCAAPGGAIVSCTTDTSVCAVPSSCAPMNNDSCDAQCQTPGQMIFGVFGNEFPVNFGGLAGADAFCQGAAQQAEGGGLPGTWMAVLSDSETHARDRLPITGPVFNTRKIMTPQGHVWERELVALNADEFWSGSLRNAPAFDQNGFSLETSGFPTSPILTGSDQSGRALSTIAADLCNDWQPSQAVSEPGECGNHFVNLNLEECDNGPHCADGRSCLNQPERCATYPGLGSCLVRGGDGCSETCTVEPGWTCTQTPGYPSTCSQVQGRIPTGNALSTSGEWLYDSETTIPCLGTAARLYCLQLPLP